MEAGVIDEMQLKAALAEQRKWGGKLGRTLVEMGFLDEESMVLALSRQLGLQMVNLEQAKLPEDVVRHLRVDIAERYGIFPLSADHQTKVLTIATSDPTNIDAQQELAFHTGMRIHQLIAGATAIERAIRRYYYGEQLSSSQTTTPQDLGMAENTFEAERLTEETALPSAAGRAPPAPAPAAPPPVNADLLARLAKLGEKNAELEKLLVNEVKALRTLLELLVEKGVVTREEFLARLRARDQ